MKAIVLAAGLGTRLRPLTELKAKPALPVIGIPTLWYPIWQMSRALQVSEFAVNMSHLPETVAAAVADRDISTLVNAKIKLSDESDKLLGSSGGLWKLKDWAKDSPLIAVSNGDTISLPDWKMMLNAHHKNKSALTLHLRRHEKSAEAYSNIGVEKNGRVTGIGEKAKSGVMFAGNYILDTAMLSTLPDGVSEFRKTLLDPLIAKGKVYSVIDSGPWFDTGTVSSYAETQFDLMPYLDSNPSLRVLVETKMRKLSASVWVPKSWPSNVALKIQGPAVITGDFDEWHASLKNNIAPIGPRFVGVDAPAVSGFENRNVLVSSNHVESLK